MKNPIEELTEGMQSLCTIANRIVKQEGRVSRIEADLMLQDLRTLYDITLRLCDNKESIVEPTPLEEGDVLPEPQPDEQLMAMVSTMASVAPEVEEEEVPQAAEPAPAEEPAEMEKTEEMDLLFEDSTPEELAPSPTETIVTAEEIETIEEIEPTEPIAPMEPLEATAPAEAAPKKEPQQQPVQVSLLDYLQPASAQRTLAESLAEGRSPMPSLERKVADLRTVINFNDRYTFMSDLFGNNIKEYNDFIATLNNIGDRTEALSYVQRTSEARGWDPASNAVTSFYHILDKKF